MTMSDIPPLRIPHKRQPLRVAAIGWGVGTALYLVDTFHSNPALPMPLDLVMAAVSTAICILLIRVLRTSLVTLDSAGVSFDYVIDRWTLRWDEITTVRERRVLWTRNIEVEVSKTPPRRRLFMFGRRMNLIPAWALPMSVERLLSEMRIRAGPEFDITDAS